MGIPAPLIDGWYTSTEIKQILSETSRQNIFLIARRANWETKRMGAGQANLYSAKDVVPYIKKRRILERAKLAQQLGIVLYTSDFTDSTDKLPGTERYDIKCPKPDCKGFAIKVPKKGWACVKGHSQTS